MEKQAVIYIRVSDPSQIENNSLATQEKTCREFAKRCGYNVIRVFKEEGITGKHTNRQALRELLVYCYQKVNKIQAVIVYKYWRFSRNTNDGLELEASLAKKGVEVLSATELVNNNPHGRFIKTMIYATGQLDNEIKAEIVRDNMQSLFRKGVWCWKCPIGYVRPFITREENRGKSPIPHEHLMPIIYGLFLDASLSKYSKQQLADRMNMKGFKEYAHFPANIKTVNRILKNSFYYGKMYCKKWNEYADGCHKPIVDMSLWSKAHYAVFGTQIKYSFQQNDIYPLKGTIKCEVCGKYMTSSNPRGRTKTYTHYECGNKACRGARIGTEEAHRQFLNILTTIKPTERTMKLFSHMVFSEWDKTINTAKKEADNLSERKNLLEADLVSIRKSLDKGIYSEEMALKEAEKIKNEIVVLNFELSDKKYEQYDGEKVRNFIEYFLFNLDNLWKRVDEPAMKHALQKGIFTYGIVCTQDKKIRTAGLSPSFELIRQLNTSEKTIGDPFNIATEPNLRLIISELTCLYSSFGHDKYFLQTSSA